MAESKYGKYFKDTIHCPLNFKVVNKPVIFMNVALTPQYVMGPPGTPPPKP